MIVHEMKLHDNGFYRMKSGIKRVEVRLFDEKRRKIAIGDHIMFTNTENPKEQLSTKVTWLLYYPRFNEMFEDLHQKYFSEFSQEELKDSMLKRYAAEQETTYGTIAIKIELLHNNA